MRKWGVKNDFLIQFYLKQKYVFGKGNHFYGYKSSNARVKRKSKLCLSVISC